MIFVKYFEKIIPSHQEFFSHSGSEKGADASPNFLTDSSAGGYFGGRNGAASCSNFLTWGDGLSKIYAEIEKFPKKFWNWRSHLFSPSEIHSKCVAKSREKSETPGFFFFFFFPFLYST